MRNPKKSLAVFAFVALFLSACADNQNATSAQNAETSSQASPTSAAPADANRGSVRVHTALGEQEVVGNPYPLAVFDMTAMQNLAALNVAVQGMPANLRLSNLKAANTPEAADIGTLFEPDLEALHALAPKAVIVGSRMAEKADAIARVAPVLNLTIDTHDAHQATTQQLRDFGALFNKTADAEKLIAEIDEAIAQTKQAAQGKGNALAILVNGNKLSAYGKNSRYGFLHTAFGMPMADETIQDARHGQPIGFEYIQKVDPDWLFVLDRSAAIGEEGAAAETVLDNALMRETKAYKNKRIVYLSADSYLAFGGYYQWLKDAQIVRDALNASP